MPAWCRKIIKSCCIAAPAFAACLWIQCSVHTGVASVLTEKLFSASCRTTDTTGDTVNGLAGAVSIANKVTDTLQDKYMWLADTAGSTVYKIDTTLSGVGSVVGEYAARPSASAGNPVAFAVLSNGDAFVSSPCSS